MNLRATIFARMATPIKPVMDNSFVETFFFFVPNRLVWDNWEKFNGAQDDPGDSTDFTIPQCVQDGGGPTVGNLTDYFGLPIGVGFLSTSALPFRGYRLIWNEWFRDQNLQDSLNVITDNGPDGSYDEPPTRRGKQHDYFSSSLPFPQKGPPVTVDLGGNAPITTTEGPAGGVNALIDGPNMPNGFADLGSAGANVTIDPGPVGTVNLFADLSSATGFTINDLRQSFAIQRMLERDARGGTRYTEIIRSHFGVTSPDMRLQRPEFLGGGSAMVNINPVAQTTQDIDGAGANTPQGNLAAFGTASARNHGFTKSFTEHGHIIGLINVRADITYQQGLNRFWSRLTRYDFYWPALSHLGEQAVLSKEIFMDGSAADDDVWGYQEAFAEYRYKPSIITGGFRSQAPNSLDVWHYGLDFATRPVLSAQFIEDNPPIKRTLAVQTEPEFLVDCYFNYRCARPMPLYGVPGLIDHF